jgi:hypothetical protein
VIDPLGIGIVELGGKIAFFKGMGIRNNAYHPAQFTNCPGITTHLILDVTSAATPPCRPVGGPA